MKLPRDKITREELQKLMKVGVQEVADDLGVTYTSRTTKEAIIVDILAKIASTPAVSAPTTSTATALSATDTAIVEAITNLNQNLADLARDVQELKRKSGPPPFTPTPLTPRPASSVPPAPTTPVQPPPPLPGPAPKESWIDRAWNWFIKN